MICLIRRKRAFSLSEIIVTVTIVALVAIPVLYMLTSTRKHTTHAINYLRAIELGNEVLDWVHCLRYEQITTDTFINSGLCESLTEDSGGNLKCKTLSVSDTPANDTWKKTPNLLAKEVVYPEQYAMHYFYRDVEVEDLGDNIKKVTVKVYWAESSRPKNINDKDDEGRKNHIVLSTIAMRDRDFSIKSLEN